MTKIEKAGWLAITTGAAALAFTVTPQIQTWWLAIPLWVITAASAWRWLRTPDVAPATGPVANTDAAVAGSALTRLSGAAWQESYAEALIKRAVKAEPTDIIKELTQQIHFATDTLLHAHIGEQWSLQSLRERISLWEQDVLALLQKAGASESDKSEFQYLVTFTPRGLRGADQNHTHVREMLAEQIHRLREITRRLEDEAR